MGFRLFGVDITFDFWFFVVFAVFLTFGRESLAMYFILPVIIHECGHVIAMFFCGVNILSVNFTAFSVDIKRGGDATASYGRDIIVCSGGIAANLITAAYVYFFTFQSLRAMFFVAVNIAVAVFNIMPVGNLDGGQLFRLVLERFGSIDIAYKASKIFSFLILIPIFTVSIFLMLQNFANVSLLLAGIYLAAVVIFRD